MEIKPTQNPLFNTVASLDAAFQIMQATLQIPRDELFPLVMMYHNTLLKEAKAQ